MHYPFRYMLQYTGEVDVLSGSRPGELVQKRTMRREGIFQQVEDIPFVAVPTSALSPVRGFPWHDVEVW